MSFKSIFANTLKIRSLQMSVGADKTMKSQERLAKFAGNLYGMSQLIGGNMPGAAKKLQVLAVKVATTQSRPDVLAALNEIYNIKKLTAGLQDQVNMHSRDGSWFDTKFQQYNAIREAAENIMQAPHYRLHIVDRAVG